MPFLFQMQVSAGHAVKAAVKTGESRIFDLAHVALVKKENRDEGAFSIRIILPVKPGSLSGGPSEKLVNEAADELLRLTGGIATVKNIELKKTFNFLTFKSGKEVVADLEPEPV